MSSLNNLDVALKYFEEEINYMIEKNRISMFDFFMKNIDVLIDMHKKLHPEIRACVMSSRIRLTIFEELICERKKIIKLKKYYADSISYIFKNSRNTMMPFVTKYCKKLCKMAHLFKKEIGHLLKNNKSGNIRLIMDNFKKLKHCDKSSLDLIKKIMVNNKKYGILSKIVNTQV